VERNGAWSWHEASSGKNGQDGGFVQKSFFVFFGRASIEVGREKTSEEAHKAPEMRKAADRGKRRGRMLLEEKGREAAREGTCERRGQQQERSRRRVKGRNLKADIIASIAVNQECAHRLVSDTERLRGYEKGKASSRESSSPRGTLARRTRRSG
jgi:hypothetical protein